MSHPKRVLITGGSGLIGSRLTRFLLERGHTVSHLTRSAKANGVPSFIWDVDRRYIDPHALRSQDAVIHLAGTGVADDRWTVKRKVEIRRSRVDSARLLADAINKSPNSIQTLVSISGIGYYGYSDTRLFNEKSPPAKDFLAMVCQEWEEQTRLVLKPETRVIVLRTGVVLSKNGGALKELAKPVRYFIGAPLGKGTQIMSWIHIDDLCGIFLKAIDDPQMVGVYNAVTPNPVTNRQMTKAIGKVLGRPIVIPAVASFVLKLFLGEMAEMVLEGSRVSSKRISDAGYAFRFAALEDALRDLLA